VNARKFALLFFHAPQNIRMNRKITTERRIRCHRRLPIELEKYGTKTSRGPKHFVGPPHRQNGYYSNQKNSSMQVYDVVICEVTRERNADSSAVELAEKKQVVQEPACAEKNL
jgi:hypothetical protein